MQVLRNVQQHHIQQHHVRPRAADYPDGARSARFIRAMTQFFDELDAADAAEALKAPASARKGLT